MKKLPIISIGGILKCVVSWIKDDWIVIHRAQRQFTFKTENKIEVHRLQNQHVKPVVFMTLSAMQT